MDSVDKIDLKLAKSLIENGPHETMRKVPTVPINPTMYYMRKEQYNWSFLPTISFIKPSNLSRSIFIFWFSHSGILFIVQMCDSYSINEISSIILILKEKRKYVNQKYYLPSVLPIKNLPIRHHIHSFQVVLKARAVPQRF